MRVLVRVLLYDCSSVGLKDNSLRPPKDHPRDGACSYLGATPVLQELGRAGCLLGRVTLYETKDARERERESEGKRRERDKEGERDKERKREGKRAARDKDHTPPPKRSSQSTEGGTEVVANDFSGLESETVSSSPTPAE